VTPFPLWKTQDPHFSRTSPTLVTPKLTAFLRFSAQSILPFGIPGDTVYLDESPFASYLILSSSSLARRTLLNDSPSSPYLPAYRLPPFTSPYALVGLRGSHNVSSSSSVPDGLVSAPQPIVLACAPRLVTWMGPFHCPHGATFRSFLTDFDTPLLSLQICSPTSPSPVC